MLDHLQGSRVSETENDGVHNHPVESRTLDRYRRARHQEVKCAVRHHCIIHVA